MMPKVVLVVLSGVPHNVHPFADVRGMLMDAKELGELIDRMWSTREERLALNKQANSLEEEERALKATVLAIMAEEEVSAAGGSLCRVEKARKPKITVGDWDQIRAFIVENDAWDLMYRRVNDSAVKERLEQEVVVPGIVQIWVDELSVHKVK